MRAWEQPPWHVFHPSCSKERVIIIGRIFNRKSKRPKTWLALCYCEALQSTSIRILSWISGSSGRSASNARSVGDENWSQLKELSCRDVVSSGLDVVLACLCPRNTYEQKIQLGSVESLCFLELRACRTHSNATVSDRYSVERWRTRFDFEPIRETERTARYYLTECCLSIILIGGNARWAIGSSPGDLCTSMHT